MYRSEIKTIALFYSSLYYNNIVNRKGKKVDIMSTIKPIQATPELKGKDAVAVLLQVNKKPTQEAMKRNQMLSSVLANIRK